MPVTVVIIFYPSEGVLRMNVVANYGISQVFKVRVPATTVSFAGSGVQCLSVPGKTGLPTSYPYAPLHIPITTSFTQMGLVKLLNDALVHHDELDGLTWSGGMVSRIGLQGK